MDRVELYGQTVDSNFERVEGDPYSISQMPDKETLEDYLRGSSGPVSVIFDIDRGVFVRVTVKNKPQSFVEQMNSELGI